MYISASLTTAGVANFTPAPLLRAAALHTYETGYEIAKDGGSQLQRWSSIIGIITAIIGNILISFALNIQRYAHIRLNREREARKEKSRNVSRSNTGYGTNGLRQNGSAENAESGNGESSPGDAQYDDDDDTNQSYLHSPYWWAGIALMTLGETGNFLAYGFAPASIVSPLGVVALISNCVIAPIMLKEQFRMRDFWGVVIAVGGAVTVVLSAKQEEKKLGPHEVLGAITRTEFEVYMGITIGLIALLTWLSPRYGGKTILIDLGLVGLFGGYTALSTKAVASMLSSTLWRAFTTPVTYVLILVLIVTAIMQVKYLNKSLQRFDSTQVIPVQFVMFTISVIIGSAILYRDFESATADSAVKFAGGCLLTFFGVYLITSGRQYDDDDEEDEAVGMEGEGEQLLVDNHDGNGYDNGTVIRRPPRSTTDGYFDIDSTSKIESRRSSRISFGESTAGYRTPQRLYSNASTNSPSIMFTPALSATEMAHGHDIAPVLENPWTKNSEGIPAGNRPPGMSSTNSAPLLPTDGQASPNSSRPGTSRISTQGMPHTHPNQQLSPQPPHSDAVRPSTRHSISRIMPGPLIAPLSSSLSAVIAESLRRGVDSPLRSKSSFTRPRAQVRRTKSGLTRIGDSSETVQESDAETESLLGSSPLKQTLTAEDPRNSAYNPEPSKRSRARSLSNTLGDFLAGKRRKKGDYDTEPGPSNR